MGIFQGIQHEENKSRTQRVLAKVTKWPRTNGEKSKTRRGITDWEEKERARKDTEVKETWLLARLSMWSLKSPMRMARIRVEE